MGLKLKQIFTPGTDEVEQQFTINAWHVSQSVDALTGAEDYDITISGSLTLTGSAYWTGDTDAAGITVDHVVIDQTTGKLYTTGSVGGAAGTSGTSGAAGTSGTSGRDGINGRDGANGTSGTSGAGGSDSYISNVQFSDPNLVFTGVGSGFNGTVGLSGLIPPVPSPGGSTPELQYNNAGSFGGAQLYYDSTNHWLGVNVNTPSAVLHVSGSTSQTSIYTKGRVGIGTNLATNGFLEITGNVSGTSIYASHNIVAYSDARSKTNVTTIDGALDKVDAIRGVTYNKVDDPDGIRYMGVIAQELQEVLPEVVAKGEDGTLAVAYGNIVGVLIEAVKELRAEIKELKADK